MKGFDHAVKAIKFIHKNRCWTLKELTDHVGVSKKRGFVYRDVLCQHYPVRVVRTVPNDHPNGGGVRPALYTIF